VTSALKDYKAADAMFERALTVKMQSLGETHSLVAITLDHSASNLMQLIDASSPRYCFSFRSLFLGFVMNGLLCSERKNYIDAGVQKYQKAIAIFEKSLGKNHSARGISLNNYAVLLLKYSNEQTVNSFALVRLLSSVNCALECRGEGGAR
jgi:hypothetical protein